MSVKRDAVGGFFCLLDRWWEDLGQKKKGENVLEDLDALPTARLVAVFVLGPAARVGHAHRLDRHGVGSLAVVRDAAGPLDRAVRKARVATGPDAQPQVHGRLREILAPVRVGVHESPDECAVDIPLQLLGRPVDGVVVERLLRRLDRVVVRARGTLRFALAVVVCLDVAVVAAHELPVDFVEIVRLEHHGGDDALARGSLHDDLGLAEEEVEVGLDGGGVEALVDGELGAVATVVDDAGGGVPDCAGHGGGGEVDAVV